MFLKSVNFKINSITARLTLFFSITTIFLIAIITVFLYGTTIHLLHNANDQFLSNEIDILAKILSKPKLNKDILEHKVIEVPHTKTGSVYRYFIRILDQNNNVVIETPHMTKIFHGAEFFKQKLTSKDSDWWDSVSGHNFLLMQAPAKNAEKNSNWTIQVAIDISYQQSTIKMARSILGYFIVLTMFLSVLLGYLISKKVMHRLYELTETTKKISISSLNQQIDVNAWPAELKALGIAFNKMLQRIDISFSQLTQFSADLAHELRTPINNIMGQTELSLSRELSSDEYQNILGSNLEELQRVSQIIDNLLFLARAENLQIDLKKSQLNIRDEINLICDFYFAIAEEKNIKIICNGDASLSANSIMFRRMISNILSNALKYTPNDGMIHIDMKEKKNHVHITICDNGIGIAAEHLPKIFNRFYRIDTARSHNSGGTGLGLAIVKSIVELHQGTINIQSELGSGSVLSLHFPK